MHVREKIGENNAYAGNDDESVDEKRERIRERKEDGAQVNTQARSFSSGREEEGEERRLRGDRVLSERREADESERARALIKKVAH